MRRFSLLFFIGLLGLFSIGTFPSCKNETDKSGPPAEEVGSSSEQKLPTAESGTMSEEEKEAVAREKGSVIEEIPLEESGIFLKSERQAQEREGLGVKDIRLEVV